MSSFRTRQLRSGRRARELARVSDVIGYSGHLQQTETTWVATAKLAGRSAHLSHRERSDRIARCDPGEGLWPLDRVAPPHPDCCGIRPLPAAESWTERTDGLARPRYRPYLIPFFKISAKRSRQSLAGILPRMACWISGTPSESILPPQPG